MYDVAIIGGGPAGLVAGTYLARFRRETIIIDAGASRASWIPTTHNFPGFIGIGGNELLSRLKTQALHYGASLLSDCVAEIVPVVDGYGLLMRGGKIQAKKLILATGLDDIRPRLADGSFSTSELVRMCPICDAYEALDKRIGVIGSGTDALSKAKFLRTYSKSVVLFSEDALQLADNRSAQEAGITVVHGPFRIEEAAPFLTVRSSHNVHEVDFLYPALGCKVRSGLALNLGAMGMPAGTLRVDEHQETTLDGIFAIGDVVADLHQLSVAVGHAAIAATAIHNKLPASFR
jgi:thioredoxin reductase (NADPH)